MPSPCSTDLRWRIIWLVLGMRKPAREVAELLGVTQRTIFNILCGFRRNGNVLPCRIGAARGLSCLRCNKVFSRMDSLKRHMKIHPQRKKCQCTTCTKIFYRRDKKAQHEASCSRLEAIEEQQQNVPFERLKAENQTGGASVAFKSTEADECQSALNANLKLR